MRAQGFPALRREYPFHALIGELALATAILPHRSRAWASALLSSSLSTSTSMRLRKKLATEEIPATGLLAAMRRSSAFRYAPATAS